MYRFNSFSPGQKAIHVGITRGFMKAPGFHPSLTWSMLCKKHKWGGKWSTYVMGRGRSFKVGNQLLLLLFSCVLIVVMMWEDYRIDQGIRNTSRQISFEFLFIKTCPPDKLHNGFGFVFNSALESVMWLVRGASFDKKEFKRNLVGSVSYLLVYK